LTEITSDGSQIFFVCLVGVWQRNFEPAVFVHGTTGWELVVMLVLLASANVVRRECSDHASRRQQN